MAAIVLTNAFAYIGGQDLTGDSNKLMVSGEGEAVDKTTFRSGGWTENTLGLRSYELELNGFADFASTGNDSGLFTNFGVAQPATVGPAETDGGVALLSQAGNYTYQPYGQIGEMAPFTVAGKGMDAYGLVEGVLLKAKGTVSATGATGTAVQLGAVGASQFLYASFHVFSAGTTITAVVESDDNAGFTSATTRVTFGPITTTGGTWATRVAGAITDDRWRLRVTAVTGTFSVAAAIAIR